MRYEVGLRPEAEADLINLYRYIASERGRVVARQYIQRIEKACMALETFPERGTRRDDLHPGVRIVGFERRVSLAFSVSGSQVRILRVFYGGREYEPLLRNLTD